MCSTCFGHQCIHHQELATILFNYNIGRLVLGSMCVGDLLRLGLSSVRVAGLPFILVVLSTSEFRSFCKYNMKLSCYHIFSTSTLAQLKNRRDTYRQIMQDKVNLSMKLKEHENIKLETNNLFNLLQHAVKETTPNSDTQRTANNISYEIKRLVSEKRTARSIWQRTHTRQQRICNRASNKLKSKL